MWHWFAVWIIVFGTVIILFIIRNIDDFYGCRRKVTASKKLSLISTDSVIKRNEERSQSIKRVEERRLQTAIGAQSRRLDTLSAAFSGNLEEFPIEDLTSSKLLIEPSVFHNYGATKIANMDEELQLKLTAATNEDLHHDTSGSDKLQETLPVTNWSKYEQDKIADLEKFDKKDRDAANLVKKMTSTGDHDSKVVIKFYNEMAPSQTPLMPNYPD